MQTESIRSEIDSLFDHPPGAYNEEHFALFARLKDALNTGAIRAAEPDSSAKTGWRVNLWVKKGILLGFRMGGIVDMSVDPARQPFFDKATWPVKRMTASSSVRIVPGGSSIRDGCFIGKSVTCMPPMYINAGAWVGDGTMVDSHALVGSCAQVGMRCHISAAAQIGGGSSHAGASAMPTDSTDCVDGAIETIRALAAASRPSSARALDASSRPASGSGVVARLYRTLSKSARCSTK